MSGCRVVGCCVTAGQEDIQMGEGWAVPWGRKGAPIDFRCILFTPEFELSSFYFFPGSAPTSPQSRPTLVFFPSLSLSDIVSGLASLAQENQDEEARVVNKVILDFHLAGTRRLPLRIVSRFFPRRNGARLTEFPVTRASSPPAWPSAPSYPTSTTPTRPSEAPSSPSTRPEVRSRPIP